MTIPIARTRHDDAVVVSQTVTFDEVGALTTAVVDHIVADGVELNGVVAAAGDTGDSDAVETDCRSGETATGVSVREGYRVGGVVVVARPAKEAGGFDTVVPAALVDGEAVADNSGGLHGGGNLACNERRGKQWRWRR